MKAFLEENAARNIQVVTLPDAQLRLFPFGSIVETSVALRE